ncbi:unnamed protein product [Withania somnifera]
MEDEKKYVVEVEKAKEGGRDGRPSTGQVYRNVLAKDGFRPLSHGLESCWDIFCESLRKFPDNPMLGEREMFHGQAGKYVWLTYREVYDLVLKVGASIRVCGVKQGAKCGRYGANCSNWVIWVISMQACIAHGLYCVPLYDTLGAGAVEYIICHAEISIAFTEESKISEVLKAFPNAGKFLKVLVSFDKITREQKDMARNFDLKLYSWDKFLLLGMREKFDLPAKKKTDICTIMYSSGTTGDPKGVMISNESILSVISGVNHLMETVAEEDVKQLIDDIKEPKPTVFCSVPRVLDRIYSGLTETCAGSFVARPDELAMVGTVGPPLPIIDVCLESVPEMGHDALGDTPRGEICIRGKCLFSGYYKREDLTKEVLVDGWFHRGDIGEWQPDGSMKIIDRKKNIFKLSQGEYVAVENLEGIYSLAPSVDAIWIYGCSYESFLVAVVNPNMEALQSWANENGMTGDFDTICETPKAKAYILSELTNIAKEKKLKGFEFIKAVHLDPIPFDMERELITPTHKKKRVQFLKYYQNNIDTLYKSTR